MAYQPVSPLYIMTPVGSHTQNTSLSSAVSVTVPAGANAVLLGAQTQNVLFTIDGTAPTTTKGFILKAGDPAILLGVNAGQVLKFIEATTSAKLDYQFIVMGG